ncbi:uncharacterized protein C2845_PM01G23900 [Panicum miliaceum]|uniref:F-box/kelch-repeat protein n=1 Tax=Panicum miliaceum TaxID=4540 RepID=A0A3L6TK02_PANMI|nr:uncharacterized protein C2845_PM01G23900 [Panicum miliaceum]
MARSFSTATPIRRFLYLLIDDDHRAHTLRKIDTTPFFAAGVRPQHGSVSPAAMRPTLLPPPVARFESPPRDCFAQFFPLGRGVEKIVGINERRHTMICDTRTMAVRAGPDLRHDKSLQLPPSWAEVGGKLYVLGCPELLATPSFDLQALTYDRHREDWFWDPLPSPPTDDREAVIVSFADGGASSGVVIRVSTRLGGTYAFDTACGSWRREGGWTLPFVGRAQYVADYGLWFGFPNSDRGGFGLRGADFNGGTPAQRHLWPDVDGIADHADEWYPGDDYLSYLGAGRFCVTRFLTSTKDFQHIAVVTALEATLAAGSEELHMVRKASRCYHFSKPDLLGWAF